MVNHLGDLERLRNRYFAMRHGRSRANESGLIVSDPAAASNPAWGLTAGTEREITASVERMALDLGREVLVISSDFSRAVETAVIAAALLGGGVVHRTRWLRERYFGQFDLGPDLGYRQVWDHDVEGASEQFGSVEPADAVLSRTTRYVRLLEARFEGCTFLLVSHGDPLQILQTGFARLGPSAHRRLPPLRTGEIRRLRLTGD